MRVRWYCAQRTCIPVSYRSLPKVETQNLASHVESIATHAHNNALTAKGLPNCETQDFASLLFTGIIMNPRLSPYIIMAAAL